MPPKAVSARPATRSLGWSGSGQSHAECCWIPCLCRGGQATGLRTRYHHPRRGVGFLGCKLLSKTFWGVDVQKGN
eukprot:382899-Amphidinium_carterae.1